MGACGVMIVRVVSEVANYKQIPEISCGVLEARLDTHQVAITVRSKSLAVINAIKTFLAFL